MGKPHFSGLSFPPQNRCLFHSHVLMLLGIGEFILLPVHSFTDKQIHILRLFGYSGNRSGIGTIDHGNPSSCLSHDHIRGKKTALILYRFSMLQTIPAGNRNSRLPCPLYGKFSGSGNSDFIPKARNTVLHLKSLQLKAFTGKSLLLFLNFYIFDGKGQFRRNAPQPIHNPGQSLGTDHGHRLASLRISHAEKHSGKSGNMVRMVVGKADGINAIGAPSLLPHGNLSSLSTIYQETGPVTA